jgi:subtilisin family serine protease
MDLLGERTIISLNGRVWDTRQGEPAIAERQRSAAADRYFLIQFYGPVKDEWVSALEELGVTFLGYHPNYAFIVRMEPGLMGKVQSSHAVQWVGRYHPAYRLATEEELAKAQTEGSGLALNIRAFPGEDAAALQSRLEAIGVAIEWLWSSDPPLARVWAQRGQLDELAAVPGVYRVEPYDAAKLVNDGASQVMHTSDVREASRNSLLQDLTGAGQIGGMVDSGLDDNDSTLLHKDFYDWTGGVQTSRIAAALAGSGCTKPCTCYGQDDAVSSGHGTHVAGSIVGNGYSSLLQRNLQDQARTSDPSFDYAWAVGQAPEARIAFAYVAGGLANQQAPCAGSVPPSLPGRASTTRAHAM